MLTQKYRITNTAGCPVAECPVDLGPDCKCISVGAASLLGTNSPLQALNLSGVPLMLVVSLLDASLLASLTWTETQVRIIPSV
jgi:hypothetical protein